MERETTVAEAAPADATRGEKLDDVSDDDELLVIEHKKPNKACVKRKLTEPASTVTSVPQASKRRLEPESAQQCPAMRAPAPHQTLQFTGPSYAPPGLDTFYGYTPSEASMPYHQKQAHVPNVMMHFFPHMQASLPQMLPQAQVTVPPWDPRDVELNSMKAEVQRLTADNEVLRVGKRLAEQTRDKLRKELEALKKQASVKPNNEEHVIESVVLRSRIFKLSLEKEASEARIAKLSTQLAAEQSKNATMEVEVLIRKDECKDLKKRLADIRQESALLRNVTIATSPPSEAKTDYPNKKSFVSSRHAEEETRSSPSSPEPPRETLDGVMSNNGYDENNNAPDSPVATVNATADGVTSPGNAAVPKASRELTTYFRTLEDHGLSPEEIVEYLRRTYPGMACSWSFHWYMTMSFHAVL